MYFVRQMHDGMPAKCKTNKERSGNGTDRCSKSSKANCIAGTLLCCCISGVSFAVLSNALKRLGFAQVEETAIRATEVSRQYEQLMQEGKMENILSTCCPSIIALVEKHYPELTQYLAPVASPSTVHARMIHAIYGNRAKVVFIGPALQRSWKRANGGDLFAVLTLAELQQWMKEAGIELLESDEKSGGNTADKKQTVPSAGRNCKRWMCVPEKGTDACLLMAWIAVCRRWRPCAHIV